MVRCPFGAACKGPLGRAGRHGVRRSSECGALVMVIAGAAGTARAAACGGALVRVVVLLKWLR